MKKFTNLHWAILLLAVAAIAVLLLYGQEAPIAPETTTTVEATTVPTTVETTVPATTTEVSLTGCSDTCVGLNYTAGNCRVSCYGWETKVDATCDLENQKCCCK